VSFSRHQQGIYTTSRRDPSHWRSSGDTGVMWSARNRVRRADVCPDASTTASISRLRGE
jgi:hypothetical protein